MDRMLAARPLVRRVLVARVGENVEQAYRAPDGCGWRGGSTLCPILVLLAGGGLRRFSSVKSTTAGSLAVIPMEKDQSGESQFVGTHRGGQKSRPNEKSRGAKNPRFFFFLFFFFRPVFFVQVCGGQKPLDEAVWNQTVFILASLQMCRWRSLFYVVRRLEGTHPMPIWKVCLVLALPSKERKTQDCR